MASTSCVMSPVIRSAIRGLKSLTNSTLVYNYNKPLRGIILTRNKSSWHLVTAVCVERKPIVSQPKNKLEKEYWGMLQKMEVEGSLLSDHELRHREDLLRAEKIKSEEVDVAEIEKATKITAQDEEDTYTEELNKFTPASRETDDNLMSIERKLEKSLILVIKEKLGKNHHWILPQMVLKEGETLRQTAERALQEIGANTLNVHFMGNTPVGHYKYKYPKSARTEEEIFGAKVFFFKAQHVGGNLMLGDKKSKEFMWLTHSELPKYLQKEYCKSVEIFLIGESQIDGDVEEDKGVSFDNGIIVRAIQKSN